MKVITVANRRGGVGKTATAVTLGAGLRLKGKKIIFIDLDSQACLTNDLGVNNSKGYNALDVLLNNVPMLDAIIETKHGDLLPANDRLSKADKELIELGAEYKLKEALESIENKYDYAIIDTPPALCMLSTNAFTASNGGVIIPAQAEKHSYNAVVEISKNINVVKKYCNPDLKICGVIITRFNSRPILQRDMRENLINLAEKIGTKVYTKPIRECNAVKEAQALNTNILEYAPKSTAGQDYEAFIKEFIKDMKG